MNIYAILFYTGTGQSHHWIGISGQWNRFSEVPFVNAASPHTLETIQHGPGFENFFMHNQSL